jgi:wyosine [tRNA(Phe)-imidazoG37] synthetase (radical SAM superfamily)
MNHIFGPVNSRRLGRSLGIDCFQEKICNLNCIYCEVGETILLTCERAEYTPATEIFAEIDAYCRQSERVAELDFVTVTASGEPTLHVDLGKILAYLKKVTSKPLAVLTNGTTLSDKQVCAELALADVVIPSLDAALPASFRKLDRPAACLDLKRIIGGLVSFSRQYQGELWLEILFARGMNDSDEDVSALRQVVDRMHIDRLQLNTVARPPLESFARPIDEQRMLAIAEQFRQDNSSCPVDLLSRGIGQQDEHEEQKGFDLNRDAEKEAVLREIIEMLKRRPCTAADINRTFHLGGPDKVEQLLVSLVHAGTLQKRPHGDRLYYQG